MEILTGDQMRNVDRRAIDELGIPSLLLMESAGSGVAEALLEEFPSAAARTVVVLCGKGNNGGDGMVVARHLHRRGLAVRAVLLARPDEPKGDASVNHRAALASGVEVAEAPDSAAWESFRASIDGSPLVVDAILGTGIRGGARGLAARVIDDVNRAQWTVVSIDVPSGLDSDSGEVSGSAALASVTYTLCRPKLALVLEPASHLAGRWRVIPIGIPDSAVEAERPEVEWLDRRVARTLLPGRPAASHKGTYGHLLALAGSRGKSGAAVLLARAALRSGVGLMTVATAASTQERVAVQQAELMTEPVAETPSGSVARKAIPRVLRLLEGCDALAAGPGLGTSTETRAAVQALVDKRGAPAVLDADGLNAFAGGGKGRARRLRAGRHPLVLTPHPGEAARLLGNDAASVQADRLGAVRRLARSSGAIVVLKGHRTLIAAPDGATAVNASGNPGMASAGTGDVLTGMVGAFLARGMSAWDAARLAVFAHGDAGDRASHDWGLDGLIATDLIDRVPGALQSLLEPAEPRSW